MRGWSRVWVLRKARGPQRPHQWEAPFSPQAIRSSSELLCHSPSLHPSCVILIELHHPSSLLVCPCPTPSAHHKGGLNILCTSLQWLQIPSQSLPNHSFSVFVLVLGNSWVSFHLFTRRMRTLESTFCLEKSSPLEIGG